MNKFKLSTVPLASVALSYFLFLSR